jgi:putative oxidoreductase
MVSGHASLGVAGVRIMMGIIFTIAGYLKFFGYGLSKAIENFRGYGIPIPEFFAPFIAVLEFGGGILLILGLFSRYLGALYCIEFIVAGWVQWVALGKGYMGARLELMLIVGGVLLATNGSGRYALGRRLGRADE